MPRSWFVHSFSTACFARPRAQHEWHTARLLHPPPTCPNHPRFDGKQRCCRLKAAFGDTSLKCLVLDAYWWSREAQVRCVYLCRPVRCAARAGVGRPRLSQAAPLPGVGRGGACRGAAPAS